jgi:hypothetical protein
MLVGGTDTDNVCELRETHAGAVAGSGLHLRGRETWDGLRRREHENELGRKYRTRPPTSYRTFRRDRSGEGRDRLGGRRGRRIQGIGDGNKKVDMVMKLMREGLLM